MTTGMRTALRCLWLSAELADRPRTGEQRYSHGLRGALAGLGVDVTAVGIGPSRGIEAPGVRRVPVPDGMRPWWPSMLSGLPNCAYAVATPTYRRLLGELLDRGDVDVVVIDHLRMGWAADVVRAARRQGRPRLVVITHNHETEVRRSVAAARSSWSPKGQVLRLDSRKAAVLEARMLAAADMATCISEADRRSFTRTAPGVPFVVVPPGYDDPCVAAVPMHERARRAVMVGSFDWHVKAANLRRFVAAADPVLAAAGVRLTIVGRVPDGFVRTLGPLRATEFAGWVDDLATVLGDARVAVVSEPEGGGFKMKTLDYLFHRVPVAALAGCAEGLGLAAGSEMLEAVDEERLARLVVEVIDDTDRLHRMASAGYRRAVTAFSWSQRGEVLAAAVQPATVGLARDGR